MDSLMFIVVVTFVLIGSGCGQRICHYTFRKWNHLTVENIDASEDFDIESPIRGSNQTCSKATNYCYALWKADVQNKTARDISILAQGCWESSGSHDCDKNICIASRKPSKALRDTYFCCCNGNFCNEYVSHKYEDEITVPEILPTQDIERNQTVFIKYMEESYILVIITIVILLLIIVTAIFMRKDLQNKSVQNLKGNQDSIHLMENGDPYSSNFTVENLRLDGILGQGRYGAVWKGFIGDQQVAVKIFPSHHKNYFNNELDIYSLPFMNHPSLLSYFGYDERIGSDGNVDYFLFLSLAPNGCLQDYLRSTVIDWETFCKMALSIVSGVAYLHTDIQKGDKVKPCITHRDLNSKNILVKEDLSCVICDLGFATKISGSKYYFNGEERHAETKSINDVGTLRYMSPEVLEGAVNLRDCETSLKQIDVYALGLILWEIATRCYDFYPTGVECGSYKLPFETVIGHPTFEQMQILVCRHKARPLFPDLWRDSPAIKTVKETIEDCWDQDAEARLTALCVEERFHELINLNERQKTSLYPNGISPPSRTSLIAKDSQNILRTDNKESDGCASESTVETLLAISPANPQIHYKNSNQYQIFTPSVQPYQGRNPCLERNLMLPHKFDSSTSELIDKSHKHISKERDPATVVNDYLNLYTSNSSQNFMNPSYGNYSTHSEPVGRSNVPIPFLQNVNSENNVPKQLNIPKTSPFRKKVIWKNFMKVFENRRKACDLSPQIDCNASSNLIVNESEENLTTPTASLEVAFIGGKLETKVARKDEKIIKPVKSIINSSTEKEGLLLGVQNIKRPSTLNLPHKHENSHGQKNHKFYNCIDEYNKLQSPVSIKEHNRLHSNSFQERQKRDIKAKSLSEVEELDQTLFIKNKKEIGKHIRENEEIQQKSLEEIFFMENRNDSQLKDPSLRIKTPGDVPLAVRKIRKEKNAARFSLYDDRIMCGYFENETLCSYTNPTNKCPNKILNSFENIQFTQNI